MSDKVVVIIATGEREKARTGLMYAANATRHEWLSEVKLVFFGPAQSLLLADEDMQELVRQYQSGDRSPVACRFIADREHNSADLAGLGVDVVYVGSMISDLIRDGYTPMVW